MPLEDSAATLAELTVVVRDLRAHWIAEKRVHQRHSVLPDFSASFT